MASNANVLQELYEINDDPKRIEFLNDYSSFLQRKATPITRLPVMSKQVLDLYELYRLVCEKGGVLEVINKKLWQDVIKRLRLPSSITSAAFTLRTQYIKYLYPYECEKKGFSSPSELNAVVELNKRERESRSMESTPVNMFTNSTHQMSTPQNEMSSLLGSLYPPQIGMNETMNPLMFNGFDQSPLASLLTRRNLMLQYMQMMETQQNVEASLGEREADETEIEAPPIKIKREREDDEEHEIDSKKSLLYNLLTPSNTESSYEEERSIPETNSEKSIELDKPVSQVKKSEELSIMNGMQFNIKKDSNGQLIVNLKLNGVTYQGNLFKSN
ncbi:ARID3A.2 family protein [Megaselia abdita]